MISAKTRVLTRGWRAEIIQQIAEIKFVHVSSPGKGSGTFVPTRIRARFPPSGKRLQTSEISHSLGYYVNSGKGWLTLRTGFSASISPVHTLPVSGRCGIGLLILFGGRSGDGHPSSSLLALDIEANRFIDLSFAENGPQSLAGVGIVASTIPMRLYLFGGSDDSGIHNWVWMLDLSKMRWQKIQDDCSVGTCPYVSEDPVIVTNSTGKIATVFPSSGLFYRSNNYLDRYFALEDGHDWIPQRVSADPNAYSDCNGDGETDVGLGELCSSAWEWWDIPGRNICDTLTDSSYCEQPERDADISSRNIYGLRDLAVHNDIMYLAVNRRISIQYIDVPSSPVQLAELDLGVEIRDIDLAPGLLVVAADSGIGLIDIIDPTSPTLFRWIHGCGRVTAVKIIGTRIHFLTRLGIGEATINGDSTFPVSYSLLYPTSSADWAVLDVNPEHCDELSYIAETACSWFGCPLDTKRPFEVTDNLALVPVFRKVLVLATNGQQDEILSVTTLPRVVKAIRADGVNVYVNTLLGGTETISLVDPALPLLLGSHEVVDWVNGLVSSGDVVVRRRGTTIDVAQLLAP